MTWYDMDSTHPLPPPGHALQKAKSNQHLVFQKVAEIHESDDGNGLDERYRVRIVTQGGFQYEVQAYRNAIRQWQLMRKRITYTMEVLPVTVHFYDLATSTGIQSELMIKIQDKNTTINCSFARFTWESLIDKSCLEAKDLQTIEDNNVCNIAGIVENVRQSCCHHEKKTIKLGNGDYSYEIEVTRNICEQELQPGAKIVLFSIWKVKRDGICRLEGTCLSWILQDANWIEDLISPARKTYRRALRVDVEYHNSIATASLANVPCVVNAAFLPLTEDTISSNWWHGDEHDKLRLQVTLQDATEAIEVVWWSDRFSDVIKLDEAFIRKAYDVLILGKATPENTARNMRRDLLQALNAKAMRMFRWVLERRTWSTLPGVEITCWQVEDVDDVDF